MWKAAGRGWRGGRGGVYVGGDLGQDIFGLNYTGGRSSRCTTNKLIMNSRLNYILPG